MFINNILFAGGNALANIVGFVYPLFASFRAIETSSKDDDTQWLTYWVIYSLFSLTESLTDLLFNWIPLYALFKSLFLVWCYHPQYKGASFVYSNLLKPLLSAKKAKKSDAKDSSK